MCNCLMKTQFWLNWRPSENTYNEFESLTARWSTGVLSDKARGPCMQYKIDAVQIENEIQTPMTQIWVYILGTVCMRRSLLLIAI
jgi:hypothetical protein